MGAFYEGGIWGQSEPYDQIETRPGANVELEIANDHRLAGTS